MKSSALLKAAILVVFVTFTCWLGILEKIEYADGLLIAENLEMDLSSIICERKERVFMIVISLKFCLGLSHCSDDVEASTRDGSHSITHAEVSRFPDMLYDGYQCTIRGEKIDLQSCRPGDFEGIAPGIYFMGCGGIGIAVTSLFRRQVIFSGRSTAQ